MAYCVLCQEGHRMNDNCMKDVLCKQCGAMGHLSIRCSKRKPIPPTFRGSQPAPFLALTPAPPSEDHQVSTSSQNRIPLNSVDISDGAPGPTSFNIRHVFDTDSIDCDKNDNPEAESELRSFNGGKRKLSDFEEYNIEVETDDVNTVAREVIIEELRKYVTDILTVDEPQANKRPRLQSDPDMDSTGLYSTMDSEAETELDLVINISSDSEGEKDCQQTIEIRNRPRKTADQMKPRLRTDNEKQKKVKLVAAKTNVNSSKMKNVDIELEPVLEGNQSCLASGVRESDELIKHANLSITVIDNLNEGEPTISLGAVGKGSTIPQDTEKMKVSNKKQFLSSDANYQLLFVHIETFRSSKSSSTLLTQIGCCSGSSTSDFFCAIEPSGLSKYLSRYKLGGDLLRALHMTEEEDRTFQFRSQFEIVSDPTKKISCVSEKDAIMRLLEFFKGFSNCVLVTVDEDTMAILAKKLRDHEKEAFKEAVVGYTYWRRILKYLCVPGYNEMDLEEYYNEISRSDLPNYLSSKDIATILNKSVEEVRCKYWQSGSSNMMNKFICKISKKINEIPNPVRKPNDRKTLIEDLEVYSSFRPSVSYAISAEKLVQIILSSDSESENEETSSALEIQKNDVNPEVAKESDCRIEVISDSEENETNRVNMMFKDINMRGGADKAIEAFNKAREARVKASSTANLSDKAAAEPVAQPRQPGKIVQCPVCPAPGTKDRTINMGNHLTKCHKQERLIKCLICPRKVAPQHFSVHLKTSHPDFFLVNKPEASEKIDLIKRSAAETEHGDLVPANRSVPRVWSQPLARQQRFSKILAKWKLKYDEQVYMQN